MSEEEQISSVPEPELVEHGDQKLSGIRNRDTNIKMKM